MNPYSYQVRTSLIKLHDLSHQYYLTPETPIDNSCQICYPRPNTEELSTAFLTFWIWYQTIQPAETYSGKTVTFFFKFGKCLFEDELDTILIAQVVLDLLYSIRYSTAPTRPLEQV